MATVYPEDNGHEMDDLRAEIQELKAKNMQLNLALARKSSEASEAKEELKRCKLEWEIVADQAGHNLCPAAVAKALKATIGYTGKWPELENVSPEQFAHGCVDFHQNLFPGCGVRLVVIPKDLENAGILTEEQAKIARKVLGFKE